MRIHHGALKSKVGRRIFALFVLCALVPLSMLAVFSYVHVARQLFRQATDELRTECRAVGLGTVEYLQFLESEVKIALSTLEANRRDGDRLRHDDLPDGFEQRFTGLAQFDRETGAELLHLGEAPPLPELDGEQWAHLLAGKTLVVIEPVAYGSADVYIARMLPDRNSIVVGAAVSEALWGSIVTDGDHFAIDQQGNMLFSSMGADTPIESIRASLLENPVSGSFVWDRDGRGQRVAYREFFLEPSFGVRLTVGCSRSNADILWPMRSFERGFLLVSFLTILVVILLSVGQIRRSLIPIQSLKAATQRIANNDFGTPIVIESGDEFEDLGDSFNFMAASLLQRTTELEAASRAKMEFLANMSHELRTPMTAILGFAEICQDPETTEEDRDRCLGIVQENSAHLLKVINDVLDISKIDAGRMTVEHTRCSTKGIVDKVTALLDSEARKKGLGLLVDIDPAAPRMIETDVTRVQQVLINLIGNAVKFTESGDITLRVVRQPRDGERDLLAFEVKDTGIGMSAKQVDRVFEPFVQADTSTTRMHGGTGLGLSISRSLARLLGGDIEYRPGAETGSVFTLTIDLGPSVEEPPAPTPVTQASGGSEAPPLSGRALVADDVAVNGRLASVILTRAGMEVQVVESGVEAFDAATASMAEGKPFAVILMDMQMPGMDGYEATQRLRADGYDAPIIAFTSHSMAEERARCTEAGCDGFASKPIDRTALVELVRRLTGARRAALGE